MEYRGATDEKSSRRCSNTKWLYCVFPREEGEPTDKIIQYNVNFILFCTLFVAVAGRDSS